MSQSLSLSSSSPRRRFSSSFSESSQAQRVAGHEPGQLGHGERSIFPGTEPTLSSLQIDLFAEKETNALTPSLLRKVDCIRLPVTDLNAALAFYCERLGHRLIWRTPSAIGLGLDES